MKTTQLNTCLFLIAAFIISGCRKNVVINEKQAILFQIDYVNYTGGYQHTGLIIDNHGDILTYKNPQIWNFPDKDLKLSESQVRDNLGKCLNTGKKIPMQELKKYTGYIKNISLSKVTALKNTKADTGSVEYICYQFQENSGIYNGYLIKAEGDFTRENLNFFSRKVTAWLKNINDTIERK